MEFMLNTKVGYEKDQVLLIQGSNTLGSQIISFKNELLRLSQVRHVSISDYLPIRGTKRNGNGFWKEGKINEDREVTGQMWIVDGDYIITMGMKIVDGRDFNMQMATDTLGVIINQAMVRELGLTDPVGKVITNGESMPVIGIVEDFHFESMKENIRPLAMRLGISPSIVSIKVSATEMEDVITSITKVWKRFSENQPLRYTFLDESYARMYEDVQRTGRIFTSFAVLAIFVACLGLFALSAFMVEQRTKELSIRLILGASPNSIFRLLTSNFIRLVAISFLLAAPVAWLLMNKWLDDYVYKIDLTWDIFLFSGLVSMLIALITISYQSLKAAMANPASTLRTE
jgi:putative ABC transport system permease protein